MSQDSKLYFTIVRHYDGCGGASKSAASDSTYTKTYTHTRAHKQSMANAGTNTHTPLHSLQTQEQCLDNEISELVHLYDRVKVSDNQQVGSRSDANNPVRLGDSSYITTQQPSRRSFGVDDADLAYVSNTLDSIQVNPQSSRDRSIYEDGYSSTQPHSIADLYPPQSKAAEDFAGIGLVGTFSNMSMRSLDLTSATCKRSDQYHQSNTYPHNDDIDNTIGRTPRNNSLTTCQSLPSTPVAPIHRPRTSLCAPGHKLLGSEINEQFALALGLALKHTNTPKANLSAHGCRNMKSSGHLKDGARHSKHKGPTSLCERGRDLVKSEKKVEKKFPDILATPNNGSSYSGNSSYVHRPVKRTPQPQSVQSKIATSNVNTVKREKAASWDNVEGLRSALNVIEKQTSESEVDPATDRSLYSDCGYMMRAASQDMDDADGMIDEMSYLVEKMRVEAPVIQGHMSYVS